MKPNSILSVELTPEELETVKGLVDTLIHVDFFDKLPFEAYTALEKFVAAANKKTDDELIKEMISKRFENKEAWADDRCECKHTADDHAIAGTGLCVKESCPCMEFKKP